MKQEITVPSVGESVTQGILSSWLKTGGRPGGGRKRPLRAGDRQGHRHGAGAGKRRVIHHGGGRDRGDHRAGGRIHRHGGRRSSQRDARRGRPSRRFPEDRPCAAAAAARLRARGCPARGCPAVSCPPAAAQHRQLPRCRQRPRPRQRGQSRTPRSPRPPTGPPARCPCRAFAGELPSGLSKPSTQPRP